MKERLTTASVLEPNLSCVLWKMSKDDAVFSTKSTVLCRATSVTDKLPLDCRISGQYPCQSVAVFCSLKDAMDGTP